MPPARLQRGVVYSDHLRGTARELAKPYSGTVNHNYEESSKQAETKKTAQYKKFMDINEFIQEANKNGESDTDCTFLSDDKDFPKPNVDLLASLLTLGKMIKDQKQLIKHQSRLRESPSSVGAPQSSVTTSTTFSASKPISSAKVAPNELKKIIPDATHEKHPIESLSPTSSPRKEAENPQAGSSKGLSGVSNSSDLSGSPSPSGSDEKTTSSIPDSMKDNDYWDRRKRNNLAAKKSREERRRKELEILETAKELEKENAQLTVMLKRLTMRNKILESQYQRLRLRKKQTDSSEVSTSSDF